MSPAQPSLFDDRSEAPSVPVQSSERGAEYATKQRMTVSQSAAILTVLAASGAVEGSGIFLTRDQLLEAIPTLSVNAACGRLGRTAPLRQDGLVYAQEDAGTSRAGLAVLGYQLTAEGLQRLQRGRRFEQGNEPLRLPGGDAN